MLQFNNLFLDILILFCISSIFLGGNSQVTVRVRKNYSTETQKRLSRLKKNTWTTLGSNELHALVQTPGGENDNDWIALHIMDFFNEVTMLSEIATAHDDAEQFSMPGKGFPQGFVYKWRDAKGKKAVSVSGPEYINFTIAYIEGLLDDEKIFPTEDPPVYGDEFRPSAKEIYTKMFRIFAILYGAFLETMKKVEVNEHLNTCFKHFMFFSYAHGLTPKAKELSPLKAKAMDFRKQYDEGMKRYAARKKKTDFTATVGTMEMAIKDV